MVTAFCSSRQSFSYFKAPTFGRQDVGKGLDLLATANKAQKHKKVQKADNESDDLSEDEEDEEAKKAAERWARVRGLTGPDSSSASSFEDDSEMEGSAEGSESSAEEVSFLLHRFAP